VGRVRQINDVGDVTDADAYPEEQLAPEDSSAPRGRGASPCSAACSTRPS
jgi:hypothetical protein